MKDLGHHRFRPLYKLNSIGSFFRKACHTNLKPNSISKITAAKIEKKTIKPQS